MEYTLVRKQKEGKEPVPVMRSRQLPSVTFPYLSYPILEQTGMVEHCFTTRLGGVSRGMFASLNLSFTRGDDRLAVEENFRRVSKVMNCKNGYFVLSDQKHTTNDRSEGR